MLYWNRYATPCFHDTYLTLPFSLCDLDFVSDFFTLDMKLMEDLNVTGRMMARVDVDVLVLVHECLTGWCRGSALTFELLPELDSRTDCKLLYQFFAGQEFDHKVCRRSDGHSARHPVRQH